MATAAVPSSLGTWCCSRCSFSHNRLSSAMCEACCWQRNEVEEETHLGADPSYLSSFSASGFLTSTCAVAAAAAAGALGSTAKRGVAGLCLSTLAAVVGAALGMEAIRYSGPSRRKRVASHTKPSSPQAPCFSSQSAGERMHQQMDTISFPSPNGNRNGPADELLVLATERPLELLINYSRQLEGTDQRHQLDQAPWHILVAHQQLENLIDQNSYEELRDHFSESHPSQAAMQDAVNALPHSLHVTGGGAPSCSNQQEEDEECCAICLEAFLPEESVRTLPRCGHFYHQGCVDHWLLEHKGNCPVCRCQI